MREPIHVQQSASAYYAHREKHQSQAANGKQTTKDEPFLVGGSSSEKAGRAKLSRLASAMVLCVAVMALVWHISRGMESSRSDDPTVSCPPLMFSTAKGCELCTVCSDEEVTPCLLGRDATCASWSAGWSGVAQWPSHIPSGRRDAVTWTSLDQTLLFMFGGALDIPSTDKFDDQGRPISLRIPMTTAAHDGCKQLSDEAPSGLQWTWGDFWMYNRSTSTWGQLWPPTLPKPREAAVSWIDTYGVAYVFGGGSGISVCSTRGNVLDGFFFSFDTVCGWQQQTLRKFRDVRNYSGFYVNSAFDPMPRSYAAVAMHAKLTLRPPPHDGRERTCLGHLFGGIFSHVRTGFDASELQNPLDTLDPLIRLQSLQNTRNPAWLEAIGGGSTTGVGRELGDLWEFECRRDMDGSTEVIWTLQYHHEPANGPNHKKCTAPLSSNWTWTDFGVQTHAEVAELSARVYECLFSGLPPNSTSWPRPRIKHAAWTAPCGSTSCYYVFGGSAAAGGPAERFGGPAEPILDLANQVLDGDSHVSDLLSDLWQLQLESDGVTWAYLGGDTKLKQVDNMQSATGWPSPCRSMVAWTDGTRAWLYSGAVSDGVRSKKLMATDQLWRLELPAAPVRVSRVTGQVLSTFTSPRPVTAVQIERIATNAMQWPRARSGASAWLIHSVGGQLQLYGYGGSGNECPQNDSPHCKMTLQNDLQDGFVRIIDQGGDTM
jgi:hypothetical protein